MRAGASVPLVTPTFVFMGHDGKERPVPALSPVQAAKRPEVSAEAALILGATVVMTPE